MLNKYEKAVIKDAVAYAKAKEYDSAGGKFGKLVESVNGYLKWKEKEGGNMRLIKFRVWDGEKMVCPVAVLPGYTYCGLTETLDFDTMKGTVVLLDKTPPIMQFTGLLDKTGKEIWEGDIVKDSFGHFTKEVVEMTPYFFHEYIEYGLENATIEVIGNIYENPELLK
jgi:hypothetical protein